jgi:UDP-glucose 4-epimerase
LTVREEPRRAGDPAYLVARADRIRTELGWQPRYDDLSAIVSSSLAWERKLQREPWV